MEYAADQVLTNYAMALLKRLQDAGEVLRQLVSPTNWTPQASACHENVAKWVGENPGSKWLRGWLVFDQRPAMFRLFGVRPKLDFLAHAVVENPDRTLMDITPPPRPAAGTYPFLEHIDGDEAFDDIIAKYFLARISIYFDTDLPQVTFQDR